MYQESGDMGGAAVPLEIGAAGSGSATSAGAPPPMASPPFYSQPPAMTWYEPRVKYPPGVKADTVPGPRAAHSCNLIGNKMLVWGGWNGKQGLNDLTMLDTQTMEWGIPATSGDPPSARNNHSTFVSGTKLYVHGGHDGSHWLADLYCLDTERWTWSQPQVAGTAPSPRACHTTTLLGRKVYMYGGFDGTRCFNEMDVLDLDTMTWSQPLLTGACPQARNAQTVTVVGSKLFLFGGHSGSKHLRDLHVLDTEARAWEQPEVRGTLPPGLRGHTANLIGSKIFLFGGYDGRGRSNDLYILDTQTFKWEHPPSNESTPAGRQRHTACLVASKKLFVLSGFDGARWLSDLHVLDVGRVEETAITQTSVVSLLGDFATLVNNPASFPDVTFMVEGEPIVAHKGVLASRCAHFRAMFGSGMVEAASDSVITYPADLFSKEAFISMLEFLYTGSVRDLHSTPAAALEALSIAQYTGLDGLKSLCESALMHGVEAGSACTILIAAAKYDALNLKRHCQEFILKHMAEVNIELLQSEPHLMFEIMKEMVARQR